MGKKNNNPTTQQPSNPEGQTTKCPSLLTREGRECRKNLENNNPTTQQPDGQEQVNVVESQNVHSQNPIGASGGLDSASLAGNGGLDTLGSQDGGSIPGIGLPMPDGSSPIGSAIGGDLGSALSPMGGGLDALSGA